MVLSLRILLFAIGFSLLVSCGREPVRPITIAVNPWPGAEFLFLAQELGFFEEEGVELRLIEMGSLSQTTRAFERGQVDGFVGTLIEVLRARNDSERSPQVVLLTDVSLGLNVILARPGVESVADLRGRTVAAEPASLTMYVLARALEMAHIGMDEIDLVLMDQTYMEQTLLEGSVDAVVTYPPVSTNLQKQEAAHAIFSCRELPNEVVDVISLDAQVIEERAPEIEALIRAWDRALAYTVENPASAYAFMAKRSRVSAEDFRRSLDGLKMLSSEEQKPLLRGGGTVELAIGTADRVMREAGEIDGPDRTSDVINARPLERAYRSG